MPLPLVCFQYTNRAYRQLFMTYNPSLREEPRYQRARVISQTQKVSVLDWLEGTGRLLARDTNDKDYLTDEDPEINDLMAGDDNSFDIDDDDDSLDLDE